MYLIHPNTGVLNRYPKDKILFPIIKLPSLRFPLIYLFLFVFTMLQFGCKSLPDNPPIPQKKMADIVLDMQIAEIYSQGLGDSVKNKFEKNYDSLNGFYASVLKHYNISYSEFNEAMNWYKSHPQLMDSLFLKMNLRLAAIKNKENIKDYVAPVIPPPKAPITAGKSKTDTLKKIGKTTDSLIHKKMDVFKGKALRDTAQPKFNTIKKEN
jgi:hypothetical protein